MPPGANTGEALPQDGRERTIKLWPVAIDGVSVTCAALIPSAAILPCDNWRSAHALDDRDRPRPLFRLLVPGRAGLDASGDVAPPALSNPAPLPSLPLAARPSSPTTHPPRPPRPPAAPPRSSAAPPATPRAPPPPARAAPPPPSAAPPRPPRPPPPPGPPAAEPPPTPRADRRRPPSPTRPTSPPSSGSRRCPCPRTSPRPSAPALRPARTWSFWWG